MTKSRGLLGLAFIAAFALLALLLPAWSQNLLVPDAPPSGEVEQERVAQLITSDWTRADLNAWWAALRSMDGAGPVPFPNSVPKRLQPPSDEADWQSVRLPDVQPRSAAGGQPDDEHLQMRWYRLRYAPPEGRWPDSVALYMPRMVTTAAAVLIRTEQGWRPAFDNQAEDRDQWTRPLWVVLPAALTARQPAQPSGAIEIVIAAPVLADGFHAVSSAWIGAREDLEPRYRQRWALQEGAPLATSLALAVLGLFAFWLWLRRRGDTPFLIFSLLAAAWALRDLHGYLDLPQTPQGMEWFWWAAHASMCWLMLLCCMFTLRFSPRPHLRFERAMVLFVLAGSVLTMPLWLHWVDTVLLQQGMDLVVALVGIVYVGGIALREGGRELRVIGLGLFGALLLGAHDLLMLAGWIGAEHLYLMPFAALIVAACFLYALQRRYLGAHADVERLNAELTERLDQQCQRLQAQHDRLRDTERQQALVTERQRLMQDMHDGLGSALLSAMVAVEQGSLDQDKVVEVLRECVDDLRLVIDSLEPVGHDLVALLATMRYRLGRRLQAGGLELVWDVQDLPLLSWLEPPDALQALRLMQEALTNVLKHANARRVRIVTRHYGSYVEIRVEDDGDGFDLQTAQRGRGLKSQQKRAQRLGGHLNIESRLGHGTRMSLRLPVKRKVPTPT
ncbi:sensor histidine kinase [Paucibacter sp. R3-3]|uniref:histidine kinase n=1 Tax=Roseateles agri TaxID=3098619 RepID=A0ABU5D9Y1_9BURK|nr:sensor histidine kinase [Paucibacter sp. R3-3]MDY0743080.1 sensor histidine kinase [Paucibacter sp. R3-3]